MTTQRKTTLSPECIVEAALLASPGPVPLRRLRKLFDDRLTSADVRILLMNLDRFWKKRGLRLTETASGWRFVTSKSAGRFLSKMREEKPQRFSRAALETLAVIAYRQPVTRGDIEEIRGVSLSSGLLRPFEELGWIEVVGYRETPGRPELFATTKRFLEDFGLKGLEALPVVQMPDAEPFELSSLNRVEGAPAQDGELSLFVEEVSDEKA